MGRTAIGILTIVALVQLLGPHLVTDDVTARNPASPADAESSAFGLRAVEPGLVLLAFHPDCVHCETVAAAWATWTEDLAGAGVEVSAVTLVPAAAGSAYAEDAGWDAEVVSVDDEPRLRPLASRTPWIFVYGADGRLSYQGHGRTVRQADRAVRALTGGASGE